jgi:peptidoglycan/LPS O-acetylase OafA/YrhL
LQAHQRHRIIELDGFRGLACLVVLVAHYFGEVGHGSRFLALGWVGVDAFFILSGFLIGGILLDNRESENYFSTFYIRRGFRIFPIYYVTISVVLLILWATSAQEWSGARLPALPYFAYLQNIVMTLSGSEGTIWLLPTWTLCVEEQFYLTLPLIIYFIPKQYLRRAIISLIISAVVFRIFLMLVIRDKSSLELAEHVLLFSRWDLLFFGVFGAYAVRDKPILEQLLTNNFSLVKRIIVAGLLALPIFALLDRFTGLLTFDLFGNLAIGVTCIGFILLITNGSREAARFQSRTLRFFGQISYGLYLIHQPVAGVLHGLILGGYPDIGNVAELAVTIAAFAISVAIASASWRYLEQPLIRIGHRWAYTHRAARTRDVDAIRPPETRSASIG